MKDRLELEIENLSTAESLIETYGYDGAKSMLNIRIAKARAQAKRKGLSRDEVHQFAEDKQYYINILKIIK